MGADSTKYVKEEGSRRIKLRKLWGTKVLNLLFFVVIFLLLFLFAEIQNFHLLSLPIPSDQQDSSLVINFPPDLEISANITFPTPTIPDPTIPEPTIPESAIPEPTIPDPAIPEPTLPEPITLKQTSSNAASRRKKKRKRKVVESVVSMSDMEDLLSKNRASPNSTIPVWVSKVDKQMLQAKSEIENAPIVTNDEQLYGPVFRNLSTFKRSYELMEKTLKVYVYKDGDRPIFHNPPMVGIYASEGWFMKHMEASQHFLVDNPTKAHLFYVPFSSARLRATLYIPDSHKHLNIIAYLQNYMQQLSSKYPFWNRTNGADHFLVGCHDWATHETEHSMKTAVRALCTSDARRGFEIGKDVALPATKIYHVRFPQRHIGGNPPHKRTTLAFFAGAMHGYLRPILIKYWENKDPDMVISGPIPRTLELNTSDAKNNQQTVINPYLHYMKSSKYCLCPRGSQVWSTRVMESIYYECVPVIISDNFVPPLFEVLNWSAFSVVVPEKDVPRLKEVLLEIPQQRYLDLGRGVREVRKHFLWNTKPVKYDLFHMILHSVWFNRLYQIRLQ